MTIQTLNLQADGNTDAIQHTFNQDIESFTVIYQGDFGGGTLKAQISHNGTDWVDIPDSSQNSASTFGLSINIGSYIRFNLASSTNPNVNIHLIYNSN